MADEQARLIILKGFRSKIEVYTPQFVRLLGEFKKVSLNVQTNPVQAPTSSTNLPSPERIIQTIVSSKSILPSSASVITNAITQQGFLDRVLTESQLESAHIALRTFLANINRNEVDDFITELEQQVFIKADPALRLSLTFIRNPEVKNAVDTFITLKEVSSSSLLFAYTYLYFLFLFSYFWIAATLLDNEIGTLTLELEKQEAEEKAKEETGQAKAKKEKEDKTLSDVEKKRDAIRKKQQASVERGLQIFLAHQGRIAGVNAFLPEGRKLSDGDIRNLVRLFADASITGITVDAFFQLPDVIKIIGTEGVANTDAISLLRQQFLSLRNQNILARQEAGLSSNVLSGDPDTTASVQEMTSQFSKKYGDQAPLMMFSMTGAELKALEQGGDKSITAIRKTRELAITRMWDAKPGVTGLLEQASGGLEARRKLLVEDWGLVEKPKSASDLILLTDGNSLLDLLGISPEQPEGPLAQEEPSSQEYPQEEQRGPGGVPNPMRAKRDIERLKTVAQVGKAVITNPYLIGGGILGGSVVYGFLAGKVAGGLGVLSSAAAGAGIGAAIGSVVPGIGTLTGAFFGAVAGSFVGASSIAISGSSSYAVSVGNFELGLLSGGQQAAPVVASATKAAVPSLTAGLQAALPTAQAGIGAGAAGTAGAAKAGLAATQSLLSSLQAIPSALASLPASTTIVVGPMAAAGIITVALVVPAIIGSFLGPKDALTADSKYVTLTKDADLVHGENSDLPKSVHYKISLKAKPGYTITLTDAKDTIQTISKGKPDSVTVPQDQIDKLKNGGQPITEDTEVTAEYDLAFNSTFADTRILNTINIKFSVKGNGENTTSSHSVSANVSFGNPPSLAGCWPANGTIIQGAYGSFSHGSIDAIDIKGKEGSPIIAPFSGTALFLDISQNTPGDAGIIGGVNDVYGNRIILFADNNHQFIFGHLLGFKHCDSAGKCEDVTPGSKISITAGDQIGLMGHTSSVVAYQNTHLHYEVRGGGAPNAAHKTLLDDFLPVPVEYTKADYPTDVPGTQITDITACQGKEGIGAQGTHDTGKQSACLHFFNGSQDWKDDELAFYKKETDIMMSNPLIKNTICRGGNVTITRIKSTLSDEGCGTSSGDSAGAMVTSANNISVCTKLFLQKGTFGRSTIWHEPGHIIQNRYSDTWDKYFDNLGEGFIPTYPLTKSRVEDFAESFGMCNATRVDEGAGYRSQPITYKDYPNHCAAIQKTLEDFGK